MNEISLVALGMTMGYCLLDAFIAQRWVGLGCLLLAALHQIYILARPR